ncbi:hypothetical protein IEQ34_006895 [Dendrobium chrysotoxum]|uniref:Cytochrome P450 n=1 Tax=Dendrobium chrysotoxum TaxID=161865 RepID=A0AAV7H7R4_DENCH|nr:hypothetical protein IEQ34_006895 [Dendrobium chrysotoxum]
MVKRSPVNLLEMLLSLSNVTIASAAFGQGSTQKKRFLLALTKRFQYILGFNVVDMFPSWSFGGEISGLRHGMEQNEIIEEHERKKLDGDDMNEYLVDVLLRIKRNGEKDLSLTMENVKSVILNLFIAGAETSSVAIVWAMIELIRHFKVIGKESPKWKENIRRGDINKLAYLNQVIKETLRLHPIAPLVPRFCHETAELACYTIAVERVSFALASIKLCLAQLLFYLDWVLQRGRSTQELDVEEVFGLILTRKNDLCLVATYHELSFQEKKYNVVHPDGPTKLPIYFTDASFWALFGREGSRDDSEEEPAPAPASAPTLGPDQNFYQEMIHRFDRLETHFDQ